MTEVKTKPRFSHTQTQGPQVKIAVLCPLVSVQGPALYGYVGLKKLA